MFNMSKEEKFNFDIAKLKQDFAIENMNITDSDIEILKKYSNDEKVFMWAALLHDIGKLTTTRVRKNRITSYNHDTEGKDIAMNILNELTDDEEFKQKVSKLVRWHMQPLFYDKNLPFFQPQDMINDVEYKEVALLSLCDRLGRGNLDEDRIKEEKERIESFKAYFEK